MFHIRSTTAITGTVNWIAATRNDGQAHWASDATLSDAWMVLHAVGALIIRPGRTQIRPAVVATALIEHVHWSVLRAVANSVCSSALRHAEWFCRDPPLCRGDGEEMPLARHALELASAVVFEFESWPDHEARSVRDTSTSFARAQCAHARTDVHRDPTDVITAGTPPRAQLGVLAPPVTAAAAVAGRFVGVGDFGY